MLMVLLMFVALLPLGTIITHAADMNGQTAKYTAATPNINYYITYSGTRTSNSQMKYDFTVRTQLQGNSPWVGQGYKWTAAITVNGVTGSAVIRERNAWWGTSTSNPDKSYHYCYITIYTSSTTGNADQSASFRVDVDNYAGGGNFGIIGTTNYTVRSAALFPTAPGRPSSASISSTTVLSGQKATLSWGAGSAGTNNPIKHYDVYYRDSTSTSFSGDYVYYWNGLAYSASVDPPAQGRYRQYVVRTVAQNAPNYSEWLAINAVYCPYTYAVTYNANLGAGAPTAQTKVQNQTLTLSGTKPTRTGYKFLGWSTSSTATSAIYQPGESYTGNAALTLYAVWEVDIPPITASVNYNYGENGGISLLYLKDTSSGGYSNYTPPSGPYSVTMTKGQSVAVAKQTFFYTWMEPYSAYLFKGEKPGWEFVGWNTDPDAENGLASLVMDEYDITLYAIYKKDITGTVIDAAGSRPVNATLYNKENSKAVTPPTQREYEGWIPAGWSAGTAPNAAVADQVTFVDGANIYYGIYQREVTLSYDCADEPPVAPPDTDPVMLQAAISVGGGQPIPSQKDIARLNSYSLTTIAPAEFTVAVPPEQTNYAFLGWSENIDGDGPLYQPGSSFSADVSTTIYSVWRLTRWLDRSETYAFANSRSSFGGDYYISEGDFDKLAGYVRDNMQNAVSADTIINNMQNMRSGEWKGSCYGMATTAILDKQNRIGINENFDPGAATLRDVAVPIDNNAVRSAINYYMVSQKIPFVRSYGFERNTPTVWRVGLERLVKSAQDGNLMLFCYSFREAGELLGHAIVISGYEQGENGSHNLLAYDNRYPDRDVIVNIDAGFSACVVDGSEDCAIVEFMSDMTPFDKIDIDGQDSPVSGTQTQDYTEISILAQGIVTVTNKAGQTLTFNAGTGMTSGTMEVISSHMIVNSAANGNPAPITMVFDVPNSDAFTLKSNGGIDVSITNKDIFASASSAKADTVVIAKNEGVTVLGTGEIQYSTSLGMNSSLADMVRVDGKAVGGASLQYSGGDIKASGAANGATLTVFSSTVDVENIDFSTPATIVLITGDGSGIAGNVDILYDSNGDGTFDRSVFDPITKPIVNGSTGVTVDYVGNKQLSVSGENITWSGSNKYVSVDQDGKVTSLKGFIKTGSATIKATNSAGSVEFNVKVKPTFGQWLMIMFLFGWIWM